MLRGLIPALMLLFSLPAGAAIVRTLDGQTLEGDLRFEKGRLVLISPGKAPAAIALDSILTADFNSPPSGVAQASAPRWQARDVGAPAIQGSVTLANGVMTIKAGGTDMAGSSDQCYLITQILPGEGQLVARVAKVLETDPFAIGGLIVRGSIDPSAPFAMLEAHPDGSVAFSFRARPRMPATTRLGPFKGPWLKIVRTASGVSGYCSSNGADWELVATEKVLFPNAALMGFVVCAKNPRAPCHVIFDHIAYTPGAIALVAGPTADRGILLRSGTFLAGKIRSADPSAIRLVRDLGQELSIPLPQVARIVLSAAPRELVSKIQAGESGALLRTGDFFQGEYDGIEDGQIRLNSVLFGPRRFELSRVLLVALREAAPVTSRYEVLSSDGSCLLADDVDIENDTLRVVTSAGPLTFKSAQILSIKAGTARFKSLADLRPQQVTGPNAADGFAIDRTLAGLPMVLMGQSTQRGVSIAPGATASYALGGQYRILTARLGVPQGIVPATTIRLVILGDDKELYRSPARTSLDEPLPISLNLTGVHMLRLKAEAEPASGLGASLLLEDPALIK